MMVGSYIERINGTVSEHSMADPIAVIAAAMPDGLLRVKLDKTQSEHNASAFEHIAVTPAGRGSLCLTPSHDSNPLTKRAELRATSSPTRNGLPSGPCCQTSRAAYRG